MGHLYHGELLVITRGYFIVYFKLGKAWSLPGISGRLFSSKHILFHKMNKLITFKKDLPGEMCFFWGEKRSLMVDHNLWGLIYLSTILVFTKVCVKGLDPYQCRSCLGWVMAHVLWLHVNFRWLLEKQMCFKKNRHFDGGLLISLPINHVRIENILSPPTPKTSNSCTCIWL